MRFEDEINRTIWICALACSSSVPDL